MGARRRELDESERYDLAALREAEWTSPPDHNCPLCDCTKSGSRRVPNVFGEWWCLDPRCTCHGIAHVAWSID